MEMLAEEAKKEGNECMKKDKYFEAVLHYTKGIKIDPYNPHIYSNRSAAFLKIQQYYHALEDANTVIRILPNWVKGYYRKGEILCAVEHYEDAIATFQKGLTIEPNEPGLQKGLQTANEKWKAQKRAENRMPWYGIAFGACAGILLIVSDEMITNKPILKNDLMRSLVLAGLLGICYGIAIIYRYFVRNQRQSLLEAPVDLLNDDEVTSLLHKPVSSSQPSSSSSHSATRDGLNTSPSQERNKAPQSKSNSTRRKKKD